MTLFYCTTDQVRVSSICVNFYTPVFRRDVLWYGDVRPGLRPTLRPVSVRPSGSPSARFPHFSPTCFDILSCHFAHDFVFRYYRSSSSVVTLRQFLKELCLFVNLEYRKCRPSSDGTYYGMVMSVRVSVRSPSVRPGLRPPVFHTFLLHALTY